MTSDSIMRPRLLTRRTFVVLSLLVCSGCQSAQLPAKRVEPATPIATAAPSPVSRNHQQPQAQPDAAAPTITFETTTHDLGEIGFGVTNTCEFRFTNTGRADLKITHVKKTCGCTVAELAKQDYAPGESGVVKVSYTSSKATAAMQKNIYVSTNDPANPTVTLTIKARVVAMVEAEPARLLLDPRQPNGGIAAIKLTSRDNTPFAVKSLQSTTTEGLTVDWDKDVNAPQLLLQPRIDAQKLQQGARGYIGVELTHPQASALSIPFEVMTEFAATPAALNLLSVKPGQTLTREITLASNYNEAFEVESISSQHGAITLVGCENADKNCKLKVAIKVPDGAERAFSDTIQVAIKGKDRVSIPCRAVLPGGATAPAARTAAASSPFRAEPADIKVLDTEPGRPITREILLSSTEDKDFEIESASSQRGYVKLLDQQRQGNKVKLQLQITPPPSQHRLEVFSDTLTLNIAACSDNDEPVKLPITCRGTYARGPQLHEPLRRPSNRPPR